MTDADKCRASLCPVRKIFRTHKLIWGVLGSESLSTERTISVSWLLHIRLLQNWFLALALQPCTRQHGAGYPSGHLQKPRSFLSIPKRNSDEGRWRYGNTNAGLRFTAPSAMFSDTSVQAERHDIKPFSLVVRVCMSGVNHIKSVTSSRRGMQNKLKLN